MSLIYDFVVGMSGLRKLSTKADIRSVGQSLAETTGLPGGGVIFLWILGSRYNCAVLGFSIVR